MQTYSDQMPQFVLYGILVLIAVGTILGLGQNRRIVVYQNYDDLGLTFAVPVLAYLAILLLGTKDEAVLNVLLGSTAAALCVAIFGFTVFRTFKNNGGSIWKTALALLTKFPLAFIWVLQIITIISPSGKTAMQRAQSRATALLILTVLTPIITALVVDRSGYFSPRRVLKGKRIGSIRDTL